ncbi:MAG: DUF3237 domain-containing protein [Sphingopyxis sp.]
MLAATSAGLLATPVAATQMTGQAAAHPAASPAAPPAQPSTAQPAGGGAVPPATPPTLSLVFTARITVGPAIEQGVVDGQRKRLIPITGGTVAGPRINGTIPPGGGDWQSIHADGLTIIGARYTIIHADGTPIAITNPGVRVASPDVIARLSAGQIVDPALYYFRTAPSFDVADGPHAWLRRTLFVGRGIRMPDHVVLQCYAVG